MYKFQPFVFVTINTLYNTNIKYILLYNNKLNSLYDSDYFIIYTSIKLWFTWLYY